MQRTALITGISGQDGSYLAELLLEKGYRVHGHSRSPKGELGVSNHLQGLVKVHRHDVFDQDAWNKLLAELQPNELYHFAADTFVPNAWNTPFENHRVNVGLPLQLLDAIRMHSPHTRYLNACSREIYGNCKEVVVNEDTPMSPTSMYGVNKASNRWGVHAYRDYYGIFAANAILFNHESPRRGHSFVTRKITRGVAAVVTEQSDGIELGNLKTQRDWGYAGDFVEAMWRMLQIETPEDFVIGTGKLHTIEEFADIAFSFAGLRWQDYVRTNPAFLRSVEPRPIVADISKAKRLLGWEPTLSFDGLVKVMTANDITLAKSALRDRRAA